MEKPEVGIASLSPILTLSASGSILPGMLLATATLLITLSVLSMLRKRLVRRASAPTPRQKRTEQQAQARQSLDPARRSVEELMVSAEELVRRLAAHLDNKAARIELLLKEADIRLDHLERSKTDPIVTATQSSLGRATSSPTNANLADPVSLDVYRLADDGFPTIEIASQLSEGVGKVELILALRGN